MSNSGAGAGYAVATGSPDERRSSAANHAAGKVGETLKGLGGKGKGLLARMNNRRKASGE